MNKELNALIDTPDEIVIGGKNYRVYPLTLGKICRLSDALEGVMPLIQTLLQLEKLNDGDIAKALSEITPDDLSKFNSMLFSSIDQLAAAFVVVTWPNDGTPPAINTESVENAKYILELSHILKIIKIIRQGADFGELLKNVPANQEEMSSPGEDLSLGPLSSPDGNLTTSVGDAALEL